MDLKKVAPKELCIATDIRLGTDKENKKPMYCCLSDLEKAFDSIYHDLILCCSLQRSIRRRTIPLTENLLKTKEATSRAIDNRETTFDPSIGVPRRDVLPLLFFIFFLKGVIKKYKTKQN